MKRQDCRSFSILKTLTGYRPYSHSVSRSPSNAMGSWRFIMPWCLSHRITGSIFGKYEPVSGVRIVERGRKIQEEKKNEGRLEGERGREPVLSLSPPFPSSHVFPVYNLTRSQLSAALYYLNAWNRLGKYLFGRRFEI